MNVEPKGKLKLLVVWSQEPTDLLRDASENGSGIWCFQIQHKTNIFILVWRYKVLLLLYWDGLKKTEENKKKKILRMIFYSYWTINDISEYKICYLLFLTSRISTERTCSVLYVNNTHEF